MIYAKLLTIHVAKENTLLKKGFFGILTLKMAIQFFDLNHPQITILCLKNTLVIC